MLINGITHPYWTCPVKKINIYCGTIVVGRKKFTGYMDSVAFLISYTRFSIKQSCPGDKSFR